MRHFAVAASNTVQHFKPALVDIAAGHPAIAPAAVRGAGGSLVSKRCSRNSVVIVEVAVM
jgi:hypothetical protein